MEEELLVPHMLPHKRHALEIQSAKSQLNYMIQAADIFAGMGAYSFEYANDFTHWLNLGRPENYATNAAKWRPRFNVVNDVVMAIQKAGLHSGFIEQLRGKSMPAPTPYPYGIVFYLVA